MTGSTASTEFLALQRAVAGRYSLERELGRGGMGVVFLAHDVALDRPVAIKLLPPELAKEPELRERFLREARTAAGLSHPNIVPIHLVEEQDGLVYFVMAFVDGESLGERIRRRGAQTPSRVSRIVQEVGWALAYSHQQGVVHRDIKPDNILLEKGSERAMVTDFGIARAAEAQAMTTRGELLGTVHYMSPEQATGEAVDGRSDIYALGVTAFHALTGRLPFEGANLPAVVHQQLSAPAPRVAGLAPNVPPGIAAAVDRCLATDPAERFATAEDLVAAVGAATVARKEVPPELRVLLRHMREMAFVSAAATIALWGSPIIASELWHRIAALGFWEVGFPVMLFALWLLSYPIRVISMARRMLRKGLGPDDVHVALVEEGRARDEELELLGRERESKVRKRRDFWFRRGKFRRLSAALVFGVGFLGLVGVGVAIHAPGWVPVIVASSISGLFFTRRRSRSHARARGSGERSPLLALSRTERLLAGRFGRGLFRVGGIGLDAPASTTPVSQPTEVFLASAADDLFDRLPGDVRRRFPTIPDVIARLEQDAKVLRVREEELSRAIAEADPTAAPRHGLGERRREAVGDLGAARDRARERLEEAVAALENIRLDLLRLDAGVGSPDDLTQDLERAHEIGQAIDAELAGRREVEALLHGSDPRGGQPRALQLSGNDS